MKTEEIVAAILTLAKLKGKPGSLTAYDVVHEYRQILKFVKPRPSGSKS